MPVKPKTYFLCLALGCSLTIPTLAHPTANQNESRKVSRPNQEAHIDKLLALPEDQIDIGLVALTLAKEIYPDLAIEAYSQKLNLLAGEVRLFTKGVRDPDYQIRAMNTYLFKRQGFGYDRTDMYGKKLENRYLNGLIETRRGSCATLPLLYLAVAQRLGYPIYPVSAPQHLFVRYVDPSLQMQNIDPAGLGGYSSDEEYIKDLEIPLQGVKSGAYLRTMTWRELVAELVGENGTYWARKGDYPKAIRYLEKAIAGSPKGAELYELLGNVYRGWARQIKSDRDFKAKVGFRIAELTDDDMSIMQAMEKAKIYHEKAKALGVAPPLPENYWLKKGNR